MNMRAGAIMGETRALAIVLSMAVDWGIFCELTKKYFLFFSLKKTKKKKKTLTNELVLSVK